MPTCHRLLNNGFCSIGCKFGGIVLCHKFFDSTRVCSRGDHCRYSHIAQSSPKRKHWAHQWIKCPITGEWIDWGNWEWSEGENGARGSNSPPPPPPEPETKRTRTTDSNTEDPRSQDQHTHGRNLTPPPLGQLRPSAADLAIFNISNWKKSSLAQVKGLYKALALETHPDKTVVHHMDQPAATAHFQRLNNAYERLLRFYELQAAI